MNDLRYAVRTLLRNPGFTAAVVLTLAIGIGPNTAVFSLIYQVLLRPLPYRQPDGLVRPTWQWERASDATDALTATEYVFWKEHNRVFDGIGAYTQAGAGFNLVAGGEPAYAPGQFVSADLFPILGVAPAFGRVFRAEEERTGGAAVVIVSHGLWRQRFGGDPGVIGRAILVNGIAHTIVGVMPAGFRLDGAPADVWLPLRLRPDPQDQGHNTMTIARLRPSVSLAEAQGDMGRLLAEMRRTFPGHVGERERGVMLQSYQRALVAELRPTLLLLMGAVGLVLLIATANAAALFLGRAAGREREFAVRAALGARGRLAVRPVVAEGMLLALGGGVAGLLLAAWSLRAVVALGPRDVPFLDQARLDLPVLAATFLLSAVVGIAIGLIPALRAPLVAPLPLLQGGDRALGVVRQRARAALVATQIALSTVLVAGAVLLIVSLAKLWSVPPGFDPHDVWAVQMSLAPEQRLSQEQATGVAEQVRARLATLPGVSSVATTSSLPLERGLNYWMRALKGGERVGQVIEYRAVSADYFATLGIPLPRGRPILAADTRESPRVVVVNRALAAFYWPDRDPIGEQVWLDDSAAQVVGVASDVLESGLDKQAPRMLYVPASQVPDGLGRAMRGWFLTSWVVRARVPLDLGTVQRSVAAVDPTQPVVSVRPLTQVFATWLAPRRLVGALLDVFAVLALTLAAVGVYGVVSYTASRRQRELGLRAALGARREELVRLVLGQGLRLAGVGVAGGFVAALLLTRFLRSLLFGVQSTNLVVLTTVCIGLTGAALLASYVPARRAARVDPMVALRYE